MKKINTDCKLEKFRLNYSRCTNRDVDSLFVFTGLKYQHWGKVLNAVRSLKLSVLSSPLPERGVLLGGSLTLHGKAVSLACFHGVNFRSQSWVLFTLQRPYMTFTSKVCTVEKSCQVRRVKAVQDLSLRLGHGTEDSVSGKLSPSSGKGIETQRGKSDIKRTVLLVVLWRG